MITKFKLFEGWNDDNILDELIEQIDYELISKIYDEKFKPTISDILESDPGLVLRCFDFEKWKADYIKGEIESKDLKEFTSDQYKDYINNHMTDDKKEKIVKLYNIANNYEQDVISEIKGVVSFITSPKDRIKRIIITSDNGEIKEYKNPKEYNVLVKNGDNVNAETILSSAGKTEYEDDMLEDLDDWDLLEIIEYSGDVGEFMEEALNSEYENSNGSDLFDDLYSNLSGKKIMEMFPNFVDTNKMKELWQKEESDDHKIDQVKYLIPENKKLQIYLIKTNKENTDKLLDLWLAKNVNKKYTIGEEYKFQKRYIKWYFKEYKDDTDEEYNADLISDALYYLCDKFKFEIDPTIQTEYSEHMWNVNAKIKYNL